MALVATMLALPVAVDGAGPVWQQLADVPTPERQEVSYVALGGKLYLAGGNHVNHERYDPTSDTWTDVAPLPEPFDGVDHVHGVAVGGKIVYIGGVEKWDPPSVKGAVAIYTPGAGSDPGSFEPGQPMPRPRGGGGVAAWNGKVIYAGGLSHTDTDTDTDGAVDWVDVYDPEADAWSQLEDMPRPRDHFQAAVVDGKLYAVGGRNTTIGSGGNFNVQSPYSEVDVLNLAEDSWDANQTSILTPRGGHGVATIGSCIYAVGGEGVAGDPDGVTGVVEAYNTLTPEWTELEPLMTARHGIQAAVVDGTIFVAAGGTVQFGDGPVAAHEALSIGHDSECWDGDPNPGGGDPGGGAPGGGDPGGGDSSGSGPSDGPETGAIQPPGSGDRGADPPRTPAAPARLKSLSVFPRRFRVTGRRRGARVRFAVSKAATVRFVVQRAKRGRRAGGRCRAPGRANRRGAPCTRWRRVDALRRRGAAGANTFQFRGRLGRRWLKPGRHRLVARVAGANDAPRRARFVVMR